MGEILGMRLAFLVGEGKKKMLNISLVTPRRQRRSVLEGRLVTPWTVKLSYGTQAPATPSRRTHRPGVLESVSQEGVACQQRKRHWTPVRRLRKEIVEPLVEHLAVCPNCLPHT